MNVDLDVPPALAASLTAAGQPVPPQRRASLALIDTGATLTCVHEPILTGLGCRTGAAVPVRGPSYLPASQRGGRPAGCGCRSRRPSRADDSAAARSGPRGPQPVGSMAASLERPGRFLDGCNVKAGLCSPGRAWAEPGLGGSPSGGEHPSRRPAGGVSAQPLVGDDLAPLPLGEHGVGGADRPEPLGIRLETGGDPRRRRIHREAMVPDSVGYIPGYTTPCRRCAAREKLAEGEGFEPPRAWRPLRFSRPLRSTAPASLRGQQQCPMAGVQASTPGAAAGPRGRRRYAPALVPERSPSSWAAWSSR
jgi:hypothetical protein